MIVNVNGLRSKVPQLNTVVSYVKPDVIVGCESKISSDITSAEVFPPGYQKNVLRKDRTDRGGGVFLAFKEGYVISRVEGSTTNCEGVWAEVAIPKQQPLYICSFYRPPGAGAEPLQELNKSISLINPRGDKHVIIAGDMNCGHIDWTTTTISSGANEREAHNELLNLLDEHSLTNTQYQSTREDKNLDLHLTTRPSLIKSQSLIPGISDHDIIVVDSDIKPTYSAKLPRKVYSFNSSKADWAIIKAKTTQYTEGYLRSHQSNSVDQNWTSIKKHLLDMLDKHIPSKYKSSRHNLPWLTNEIKRMIRRKQRKFNLAKKTGNQHDWKCYKDLKMLVRNKLRKAHADYTNHTLTTALEEGNHKPFWGYIKCQKMDAGGVAPLKKDGKLYSSSTDKAEILSEQFSSVFTRDQMDAIAHLPGHDYPSIDKLTVTEEGVAKLLSKLSPFKASGPDDIPNRLLKELSTELAPAMTALFNQSLQTGQLPQEWKLANVSPIYKKEDKHIAANYRPISLTCVCSKLLEHIVVSHLLRHNDKHSILTPLQHGFRQKHSTVSQLLLTVTDLAKYHDDDKQVDIGILDFSKAFDVVSHRKLLFKLQHYGINGKLSAWIKDFLIGRHQRVVVDGAASTSTLVHSGVPQGTCLGPILFLYYINDITINIKSQMRLFADDALIYRPILSVSDHHILQNDLHTLEQWANTWDMRFNPCKCYILSMKRAGVKSAIFYTLCGQVLESVTNNPYLGVIFSDDLSFSTHVRQVCAKASRTLGFLRRNLRNCPQKLRELAYTSMCRSVLEYASPIWDPYLQRDIDSLERIQRKAARFTTRDFRQRSSVTAMMRSLQWEPLAERRTKARVILMHLILNDEVAIPVSPSILQPGLRGRFIQPAHHYQQYKHSFYPRTIRDWNLLPSKLKDSPSLDSFKNGLPVRYY